MTDDKRMEEALLPLFTRAGAVLSAFFDRVRTSREPEKMREMRTRILEGTALEFDAKARPPARSSAILMDDDEGRDAGPADVTITGWFKDGQVTQAKRSRTNGLGAIETLECDQAIAFMTEGGARGTVAAFRKVLDSLMEAGVPHDVLKDEVDAALARSVLES